MGYELQLIVATKSSLTHKVALVGRRVVPVYPVYVYDKSEDLKYCEPGPKGLLVNLPADATVKLGSWFQTVAVIDLSKCGLPDWTCSFEESSGEHLYGPFDGNNLLGLDPYGKYRRAIPVMAVVKALRACVDGSKEPYRRYVAALALLEGLLKGFPEEELFVFVWGH